MHDTRAHTVAQIVGMAYGAYGEGSVTEDREAVSEEPRHGPYNGWCRVEGIPLRAEDCPECRSVSGEPR